MNREAIEVQAFADAAFGSADAGIGGDATVSAMTTPTIMTPTAVQYVVVGSTVCLIC